MTELHDALTAEHCRDVVKVIRDSLRQLGITTKGWSDLEVMLLEAEWIGSFLADPFEPGGAGESDYDRAIRAFSVMLQLTRLAEILHWATRITGASDVARWITGRIDRLARQDSQALDHLFELEIAARAQRWRAVVVSLQEPDIVVTPITGGLSVSIACKRPLQIESVGRAILKARDQITRQGHPGVIVLGMESIFHESNNPERQTRIWTARDGDSLEAVGELRIDAAIQAARSEIRKALRSRKVGGILFCGAITGLLVQPLSYAHRWVRRGIPNRLDRRNGTLYIVEKLLFG